MSPALLVGWWLLHRRWRVVAAACLAAVALSLLALPLVGCEHQRRFYAEVLPSFGGGEYHGLRVPVSIFGNHSLPHLLDQAFPSEGPGLSRPTRILAAVTTALVVGGLGWLLRRPPVDLLARTGQVSAVALAMLLVPVYTFEHHLIWALPAVVALERIAVELVQSSADAVDTLSAAKTLGLLVLLAASVRLGRAGRLAEPPA
ncbi:MAG TPA: glycosyltransferase 87 family protein [Thermoanaerobaculia bacterium]|nr:glycosyltransferase 87 family protein [Thermoanaerobaculia bacterium]